VKKILAMMGLVVLTACGEKVGTLPPPPKTTEVVEQKIPVPVLCTVEIARQRTKLDRMEQGQPLEEQNAAMRESIAQQKSYIVMLEAGIIGCGGKIN
jgi:predicted small lipoprotein YifL